MRLQGHGVLVFNILLCQIRADGRSQVVGPRARPLASGVGHSVGMHSQGQIAHKVRHVLRVVVVPAIVGLHQRMPIGDIRRRHRPWLELGVQPPEGVSGRRRPIDPPGLASGLVSILIEVGHAVRRIVGPARLPADAGHRSGDRLPRATARDADLHVVHVGPERTRPATIVQDHESDPQSLSYVGRQVVGNPLPSMAVHGADQRVSAASARLDEASHEEVVTDVAIETVHVHPKAERRAMSIGRDGHLLGRTINTQHIGLVGQDP